jgi:flagellar basal-body rod modification protein FlgD
LIDGVSTLLSANSTSRTAENKSYLSMEDFYALLVAQLSNQDINNTVDNTEFISQMAQFSMIQAISDLSQQSQAAYSVSLIGKAANLLVEDDLGNQKTVIGVVQGVNLENGKASVVINGNSYPMSSVREVYDASLLGGEE